MKRFIFPGIIIGIVLFFWQFISFAGANLHKNSMQYCPKQDTILSFINSLKLEDGQYMIPRYSPDMKSDEAQKYMMNTAGKPWMFLTYHNTRNGNMIMPLVRGLMADIIAGLFLIFILNSIGAVSTLKSILLTVSIGMFAYIFVHYTNHVWYPSFDTVAYLVDAIVPYTLIGFLNSKFWNKV